MAGNEGVTCLEEPRVPLCFREKVAFRFPEAQGHILQVSRVCGTSPWHTHADREQLRFAREEGFKEEVLEKKRN